MPASPDARRVVIVGAGQGGLQVAVSLREEGFAGEIVLLGEEADAPYGRPPLSKAYLSGKADRTQLTLRAPLFYAERGIALRTGVRAVAIDRDRGRVRLETGDALAYDHLVLATGSRNRALAVPGASLSNVHALRTLGNADAIRHDLVGMRSVVIVGAGFIGLEVAAVMRTLGLDVTVLEAAARPMARTVSGPISDHFTALHRRSGTAIAFGAVVSRIEGEDGRARAVETADGRVVPADLVLVGIGVVPNVELAAEAGLAIENGILTDEHLVTADPAISAIGDCVAFPSRHAGGRFVRIESVGNAVDGARCVAARLCGRPAPFRAVPWFWSDQGPRKLQIAGLGSPADVTVLRGDPAAGAFSVFSFEDDRLTRVESVDRPADHMIARRLLASATALTRDQAADPGFDLKAVPGPAR